MHASRGRGAPPRGGPQLSEDNEGAVTETPGVTDSLSPEITPPLEEALADEAKQQPRKRVRKTWSTTVKVLSGTVAVVGAVTGVLSVIQPFGRDLSGLGTLSLTAVAVAGEKTEFALPISELNDFPASETACSTEQLDWLNTHAKPLQQRFRVEMRNNASEGAMLALVDFRADQTQIEDAPATRVLVSCAPAALPTAVRAATIQVDVADATAQFHTLRNTQQAQASPEVPVSWNLAPGESGTLDIEVTAEHSTVGHLVATVLSSRKSSKVTIKGADFTLPGLWRHGEEYFVVGATGLECVTATAAKEGACTPADIAELAQKSTAATPPASFSKQPTALTPSGQNGRTKSLFPSATRPIVFAPRFALNARPLRRPVTDMVLIGKSPPPADKLRESETDCGPRTTFGFESPSPTEKRPSQNGLASPRTICGTQSLYVATFELARSW